jgi:hypothetical protein
VTASYEQLLSNLVPARDPPFPDGPTAVERVVDEKEDRSARSRHFMIGASLLPCAAALLYFTHWTLALAAGLGGALLLVSAVVGGATRVAPCPYCGEQLFLGPLNDPLQGSKCYEYSIVNGDLVQALTPHVASQLRGFKPRCPLFEGARWPKACAICGAPPTRLDSATGTYLSVTHLAVGRVRVTTAKLPGIPYCSEHRDGVQLEMLAARRIWLNWTSLRMMRQYLGVNARGGTIAS